MGRSAVSKAARGSKDSSPKAKAPRTKAAKKTPLKDGQGSLEQCWGGSPENGVAAVTRQQQSGFVTYLRVTANGKDATASSQAADLMDQYRSLTSTEKRAMISTFFLKGGKKSGMAALVKQTLSVREKAAKLGWMGYATPSKIMELHTVILQ